MACKYVLVFFILCAFGVNNAARAAEAFEPGPSFIYDQIYTNLGTPAPCVRLLDKDDVFGCTSPQKGSVGSLYLIRTEEELKGLLTSSVSVFHWVDKKTILLGGNLFNRTNVQQLSARSDVAGILVLTVNDGNQTRRVDLGWPSCTEGATGYSPAEPYPNKHWGLYPSSTRQWNPCGNSWAFEEQTVPMFALDYADSHFFLEKALYNQQKKYNWPKWTAELNAFMWASENSETCLRRAHCDPMGGQSVWSGMEDTISKDKGIILAMTQADSSAFFHELATGGDAHASSIAALLTAAQALADWRTRATIYNSVTNKMEAPTFQKELIFGFWTGEAWGYLGSRKFIWDIEHFECKEEGPTDYCKNPYKFTLAFKNLSLDRIEAIIELDQVGLVDIHSPRLYVHREGPEERTKKLWDILTNVSFASGVDVDAADSPPNWELPPSSLHSFLRANRTIPGVVLGDYKSEYKNRYYHSRWDDATNVGVLNDYAGVCKVANYMARLLWSLSMGGTAPPPDLAANCDVAYDYMECLVYNNTCTYKQKLLGIKGGPATPNHYSGIFRRRLGEITLTSKFLYEALSVITSKQAYLAKNTSFVTPCNKSSQCPPNQNMQCQLGLCRNATTYYHDAVSLGLTWQPDSLGLGTGVWVITNSTEPLYTEARWDTTGIRVFMSDNYLVELVVLLAGVIEFFVFLMIFWYVRRYIVLKK